MELESALTLLRESIGGGNPGPPPDQWAEWAGHFRLRALDTGEFFLRGGESTQTVAFVAHGLLRMFYLRGDGKEFNKSFIRRGHFVGALDALIMGEKSRISIQCLEPSALLEIEYSILVSFYERDMFWQRLGRKLAERLYIKKARREAAFLMEPALNRYESFLVTHADLEGRLTDYHIASYLGITPEALSRLKKARLQRRRS